MPVEDAEMTRSVRREISRRYIDSTNIDVRVMHGVVYLRGWVDRLRGQYQNIDLKEEMEVIHRILLQRPGIRDVVIEVDYGRKTGPAKYGGRR
ncbi:MAG: BON domain-containing protein [Armatimonadota bacterium]|nr:BON domain-containing protein [Armatimonadota bacterium]